MKPLILYGDGGPNPGKVAILLSSLELPYRIEHIPLTEVKGEAYTVLNPNGRLPTLHDPNTGITLWESGAIITYVISKYDKSNRLSFPEGTEEAWLATQWLFFQTTGQGPYYGQAYWFKNFAPEPVPIAMERYISEAKRVCGVLDGWLSKQKVGADGGKWLVGSRISYADLTFVMYQVILRMAFSEEIIETEFPAAKAWFERMLQRKEVGLVLGTFEPFASMFKL
jgi:glutathione S-transferase